VILSCDACSNEIRSGIVRDKVGRPLEIVVTGDEAGHPVGKPSDRPLNHRRPDFTIGPGPLTPASNCVSLFPFAEIFPYLPTARSAAGVSCVVTWSPYGTSSAANGIHQNIRHITFSNFQCTQILINLKECTGIFLSLFHQK